MTTEQPRTIYQEGLNKANERLRGIETHRLVCLNFERDMRQVSYDCRRCGWSYDLHLLKLVTVGWEVEDHWRAINSCPYDEYVLLVETMEPSDSELQLRPSAKPDTRVTVGKRLNVRNSEDEWQRYGVGSIAPHRLSAWRPFPLINRCNHPVGERSCGLLIHHGGGHQ